MSQSEAATAAQMLSLTQVDDSRFLSVHSQNNQLGPMFGGQMIAQALAAAHRTVDSAWLPHSLTGYFHRPGTIERPLELQVEQVRTGRQYGARHVRVTQGEATVFDALCSFQAPEDGMTHQYAEPGAVPKPDTLQSEREFLAANPNYLPARIAELYARPFPVEIRPVDPESRFRGVLEQPSMDSWMRHTAPGSLANPAEHAMIIAFLSDFRLAPVVSSVHIPPQAADTMFLTSLSHNIVFHSPGRADGWLLHRMESPWAGNGRGLARGQIFDEEGRLIASTLQETVFRRR